MSDGATMSAPARACESAAFGQQLQRRIVQNLAVLDHAAVAVAGVFAEANIGDDEQIELGLANRFDRALHRAGRGGRFRAGFVLVFRQAEENHRREFPRSATSRHSSTI